MINMTRESDFFSAWRFAPFVAAAVPSALQDSLRATCNPNVISFALGTPSSDLLPLRASAEAAAFLLASDRNVLQYGPPSVSLKQQICTLMARRNVDCATDQILLTAGAQQALSLITRLLVTPGDSILVDEAVYPGFRQAADLCGAQLVGVRTHANHGMDLDSLTSILDAGVRPAFLLVHGGAHNPLGICASEEHRVRLAEIALRYHLLVVEDDAYGLLMYEANPRPLRRLGDGWLVYIGSLSKILGPSLRAGWIAAPAPLVLKLSFLKEGSDLDIGTFGHSMAERLLATMDLDNHLRLIRNEYVTRRKAMLTALGASLRELASWENPPGGIFVWVRFAEGFNTDALLRAAIEEGVAFVPGSAFALSGGASLKNCLRLNFSREPPDRIIEGIRRLSHLVRLHYQRWQR